MCYWEYFFQITFHTHYTVLKRVRSAAKSTLKIFKITCIFQYRTGLPLNTLLIRSIYLNHFQDSAWQSNSLG